MSTLSQKRRLQAGDRQEALGIASERAADEYGNFLLVGGFCKGQPGKNKVLEATDALDRLWTAILQLDLETVAAMWRQVPSFDTFVAYVHDNPDPQSRAGFPIAKRAESTYVALAEISALAISIHAEGVHSTPSRPTARDFAQIAYDCYSKLARTDEYVLTGAWLEELVRSHHIHPVHARALLEEARLGGYLERFTQGSTPNTRFPQHRFFVLDKKDGAPLIEQVYLYHGDFLTQDRASVSLRLKRKKTT